MNWKQPPYTLRALTNSFISPSLIRRDGEMIFCRSRSGWCMIFISPTVKLFLTGQIFYSQCLSFARLSHNIRNMDTLYTVLVAQVNGLPFSDPHIWLIYDHHTWVNLIQPLCVPASPLSKQSDQNKLLQKNFRYGVTHILDSSSNYL